MTIAEAEEAWDEEDLWYLGEDSLEELEAAADVVIVCRDGERPAHKAYLMKGSRRLASLFDTWARPTSAKAGVTFPAAKAAAGGSLRSPAARLVWSPPSRKHPAAPPTPPATASSAGTGFGSPIDGSEGSEAGEGRRMRLESSFRDVGTTSAEHFLLLLYDATRAAEVAEKCMEDEEVADEVLQLCSALAVAPAALARLDAALERSVMQHDWQLRWMASGMVVAERHRRACPRWYAALASQLGARLADLESTPGRDGGAKSIQTFAGLRSSKQLSPDTLLLLMHCMAAATQRSCLAAGQRLPGPPSEEGKQAALGIARRHRQVTEFEVPGFFTPGSAEAPGHLALSKEFQLHASWLLSTSDCDASGWCYLRAELRKPAPPGSGDGNSCGSSSSAAVCAAGSSSSSGGADGGSAASSGSAGGGGAAAAAGGGGGGCAPSCVLSIHATVLSSAGHNVVSEHELTFGPKDVGHTKQSSTPWVDCLALQSASVGLVGSDGSVRVRFRVSCLCLDM